MIEVENWMTNFRRKTVEISIDFLMRKSVELGGNMVKLRWKSEKNWTILRILVESLVKFWKLWRNSGKFEKIPTLSLIGRKDFETSQIGNSQIPVERKILDCSDSTLHAAGTTHNTHKTQHAHNAQHQRHTHTHTHKTQHAHSTQQRHTHTRHYTVFTVFSVCMSCSCSAWGACCGVLCSVCLVRTTHNTHKTHNTAQQTWQKLTRYSTRNAEMCWHVAICDDKTSSSPFDASGSIG
jgi:hypothetical protein